MTTIEALAAGLTILAEKFPQASVNGYNSCVFVCVPDGEGLDVSSELPSGWSAADAGGGWRQYSFGTD